MSASAHTMRPSCLIDRSLYDFSLSAQQREGVAELRGQRGMHATALRLPAGHPRLGAQHAGTLGPAGPCVQVQGQEVRPALCRSVSDFGSPEGTGKKKKKVQLFVLGLCSIVSSWLQRPVFLLRLRAVRSHYHIKDIRFSSGSLFWMLRDFILRSPLCCIGPWSPCE